MSNLNSKRTPSRSKKVINHEGQDNFSLNAKEAIVSLANTSLVSDKFYATKGDGLKEVVNSIMALRHNDPEFALKVAAYARKEMNMRSLPQVILAECSNIPEFKPYVRKWGKLIMSRADEPGDVLSYFIENHGKPIPNALKRAIKERLEGFSEYQLSKYQRKGSTVTMADVIKLTHPNLGDIGKAIIEGTASADTWERELSSGDSESKSEAWEKMIPKMGYMALLRNLRNMIKEEIDLELFKGVLARLSDPEEVRKSKQFPFRFYSAYVELEGYGDNTVQRKMVTLALKSLSMAIDHSVDNVNIEGDTLYLVDSSGSMTWGSVSDKSKIRPVDIGALLGCMGVKKSDSSAFWLFDSNVNKVSVSATDSILNQTRKVIGMCHGGSTLLYKALDLLNRETRKFDNVVVITDMQVYGSSSYNSPESLWKSYKNKVSHARLFVVDVNGYNKGVPFKKNADDVFLFAGWSEKILEMIGSESVSGMVQEIEAWNPFEDEKIS